MPRQPVSVAIRSFACLVLLLLSQGVAYTQELQDPGQLDLTVMIVSDDLSIKPVPKWRFLVSSDPDFSSALEVVTAFDGTASVVLPKGDYLIKSEQALEFENELLSWEVEFTVSSGKTFTLELSNDNARIEIPTSVATEVPLDEGDLYHAVKSSVFKVIAEGGHGSGFLVDKGGLIVTNHHVVQGSEYLAVLIDQGRKYSAKLIVEDDLNDVAVVQINPVLVADLVPLEIADTDPSVPPASVGERVVAIGSPLATETILTSGLVSKVEEGAIYSDVSINPGNSGGPLFNMRKEVIGINTFGLLSSGPGVAGIVRGYLAKELLTTVTPDMLNEPPPTRELPVESDFRFPPEDLRTMALAMTFNPRDWHVEVGKFDVQLITPAVRACLEVEDERNAARFRKKRSKRKKEQVDEYKPGTDFYEWRRYAGDYRPVVVVQAVPEIRMTTGSMFAVALMGAAGGNPNTMKTRWRFKADFDRMELIRGSTPVEPIHPGRVPQVMDIDTSQVVLEDIAYMGAYEYPPEAFKPGEAVTIKVWKQGVPQPIIKVVPQVKQQAIWASFRPYFEALEDAAQGDG